MKPAQSIRLLPVEIYCTAAYPTREVLRERPMPLLEGDRSLEVDSL